MGSGSATADVRTKLVEATGFVLFFLGIFAERLFLTCATAIRLISIEYSLRKDA